jgi:hypothetical protein
MLSVATPMNRRDPMTSLELAHESDMAFPEFVNGESDNGCQTVALCENEGLRGFSKERYFGHVLHNEGT